MKRSKFWMVVCGLAFLLCAQLASAADQGGYIAFHGGLNGVDDMDFGAAEVSYDDGSMFGVAAGYDFGWFRLEGEFSLRQNDVDGFKLFGVNESSSGEVTLTAIMVNFFFEWDNSTPLIPYVGIGLGAGKLDFDNVSGGGWEIELDNEWGGASQIILGLGYDLGNRWHLYTDVRGVAVELAPDYDEDDDNDDDDYFATTLTLGAQYRF